MTQPPWEIAKIIEVAKTLSDTGTTPTSTGEHIAAAFVLNRQDYLPADYRDIIEAWDHLGARWQDHVRTVKHDYAHLIGVD
jgi:hypothetical protein